MNIGDKAPEILGKDEQGRDIRLSDYKGRKLVLYFYPKDNTSGCTAEAAVCATIMVNCKAQAMKSLGSVRILRLRMLSSRRNTSCPSR